MKVYVVMGEIDFCPYTTPDTECLGVFSKLKDAERVARVHEEEGYLCSIETHTINEGAGP